MDLRRLGHRISHRAPTKTLTRHTARDDHGTALGIRAERLQSGGEEELGPFDIGRPTLVPFVFAHGLEVREVGEFGPAGVGNDDVQPAERGNGAFNAALTVGLLACVTGNDGRPDR